MRSFLFYSSHKQVFDIQIKLPDLEKEIRDRVVAANNAAVKATAPVALAAVRPAIPVKTGAMQRQTQIKYFKRQFGMIGASIKVMGSRHFVEHILEYGSRTHGGRRAKGSRVRKGAKFNSKAHTSSRGPIRARHIFRNVFQSIQSTLESTYSSVFSSTFNSLQ